MKSIKIKDFLYTSINSPFMLNHKWLCRCRTMFSEWVKDSNSPSMVSNAEIDVNCNGEKYIGLMSIQYDPILIDEYYASFFIKKPNDVEWKKMFNVTNIEHCPNAMMF